MSEALVALSSCETPRARRRMGLIFSYYLYRAVAGGIMALPLAMAAGTLVGPWPRGDVVLFDPGGVRLLGVLRRLEPAATALGTHAATTLVLASVIGLVPLTALMEGLGAEGPLKMRALGSRVGERIGPFAVLFGIATVAEVAVGLLAMTVADVVTSRVAWSGPENRDLALLTARIVGVLSVLAVGLLHDVARAFTVRKGLGFYTATSCALRLLRRRPFAATGAYLIRALPAAMLVIAALTWGNALPRTTTFELGTTIVLGQLSLFAAAALRASWLAAAMRITDRFFEDEARAWRAEAASETERETPEDGGDDAESGAATSDEKLDAPL